MTTYISEVKDDEWSEPFNSNNVPKWVPQYVEKGDYIFKFGKEKWTIGTVNKIGHKKWYHELGKVQCRIKKHLVLFFDTDTNSQWSEPFNVHNIPNWVPKKVKSFQCQTRLKKIYSSYEHQWISLNKNCDDLYRRVKVYPLSEYRILKSLMINNNDNNNDDDNNELKWSRTICYSSENNDSIFESIPLHLKISEWQIAKFSSNGMYWKHGITDLNHSHNHFKTHKHCKFRVLKSVMTPPTSKKSTRKLQLTIAEASRIVKNHFDGNGIYGVSYSRSQLSQSISTMLGYIKKKEKKLISFREMREYVKDNF